MNVKSIESMKKKIEQAERSEKFLSMKPQAAFTSDGARIISFAPTEAKAKERAIIAGEDFPIIIDIRSC